MAQHTLSSQFPAHDFAHAQLAHGLAQAAKKLRETLLRSAVLSMALRVSKQNIPNRLMAQQLRKSSVTLNLLRKLTNVLFVMNIFILSPF